jgi:HAD superfamily hydrolase (TIGR01484 family)
VLFVRYLALATDYDGTLAQDGHVDDDTVDALRRLKAGGRRLVLVTGRQAGDVLEAFPRADLCDRIVAENGATLYRPETKEELLLTRGADARLIAALREQRVEPLSIGKGVVATREPNQALLAETINRLGLELEVTFNKGAVMVLPCGVDKATGLQTALDELGLSPRDTIAVGDAENDLAFLSLCARSAAVANALPALKKEADFTLRGERSAGVRDLVAALLRDDR